jgi:TM2 domain-containing membrane protein YozV
MFDAQFMALPGITPQEYSYLQTATNGLNEQQLRTFLMIYSGKRKNSSDILLFTLLGFIWIAGIQRFVIGQIGMGILYLLTGGLCFIGTIVDLINHKDLTFEHNQRMVFESLQMVRMGNFQ